MENVELVPDQRRTIKLLAIGGGLMGFATFTLDESGGRTVVGYDVYSETVLPPEAATGMSADSVARIDRTGREANSRRFQAELESLKRLVEARMINPRRSVAGCSRSQPTGCSRLRSRLRRNGDSLRPTDRSAATHAPVPDMPPSWSPAIALPRWGRRIGPRRSPGSRSQPDDLPPRASSTCMCTCGAPPRVRSSVERGQERWRFSCKMRRPCGQHRHGFTTVRGLGSRMPMTRRSR